MLGVVVDYILFMFYLFGFIWGLLGVRKFIEKFGEIVLYFLVEVKWCIGLLGVRFWLWF